MKTKPPLVLLHLKRPPEAETGLFTREEVAEIFHNRIDRSQVSRLQEVLKGIEPYQPLTRADIWKVYVYLSWRDIQIAEGKRHVWRKTFQDELIKLGEEAFLKKYVFHWGGSKEDCERLIDDYLARKKTKKLIV